MLRPYRYHTIQKMAFDELDSAGNVVAAGVAASHRERGGRNIRSDKSCGGEFFGQGNGDAAGTGAYIADFEAGAISFLRAPSSNFANRQMVSASTRFARAMPPRQMEIWFDPQTSGGLLAAVPAGQAAPLIEQLAAAGLTQARKIGDAGVFDGAHHLVFE